MNAIQSGPAVEPAPTPPARVLTHLFAVTVVFFLLAGLVIVLGQAALLVAGHATAARGWASAVAPYAFGGAAAAGVLSFLLSYGRAHDDHIDDDSDVEVEDSRA